MADALSSWTPIALSRDIAAGTSSPIHVQGQEFVVWRDTAGTAHVWEDRCPHRGMRMSFGFVRGDHIACLYHGWQYDTSGQCRAIPAHPDLDVPKTIRIRTFETVEVDGVIWMSAAEPAHPQPPSLGAVTPLRSVWVDADLDVLRAEIATEFGAFDDLPDGRLHLSQNGEDILVALQPLSPDRQGLHIVVVSPHPSRDSLRHWAMAFERLRDRIEMLTDSSVESAA